MNLGHGHRRTVVILWAWTAVLSCFVLVPAFTSRGNGIVPIGLGALALLLFTLFAPRFGRANGANNGAADGAVPSEGSDAPGRVGPDSDPGEADGDERATDGSDDAAATAGPAPLA